MGTEWPLMTAATEPVITGVGAVVGVGTGLPGLAGAVGAAAGEVAVAWVEPEELLLPQPASRTATPASRASVRKGWKVTGSPWGWVVSLESLVLSPES